MSLRRPPRAAERDSSRSSGLPEERLVGTTIGVMAAASPRSTPSMNKAVPLNRIGLGETRSLGRIARAAFPSIGKRRGAAGEHGRALGKHHLPPPEAAPG